ncbi:hypothetical protein EJB05_07890 [Eragrostis curvula]|uniref:Uncharacterized protein n=1 Tax=Eragrostis curvula TaxID=38414 RepID=A0A5J9WJK9_9POAL|nr:hypothetical protein EJB05_07890 [Eragrostis curvula]
MAECRIGGGGDCLIKLFGKTIPVPELGAAAAAVVDVDKDLQQRTGEHTSGLHGLTSTAGSHRHRRLIS